MRNPSSFVSWRCWTLLCCVWLAYAAHLFQIFFWVLETSKEEKKNKGVLLEVMVVFFVRKIISQLVVYYHKTRKRNGNFLTQKVFIFFRSEREICCSTELAYAAHSFQIFWTVPKDQKKGFWRFRIVVEVLETFLAAQCNIFGTGERESTPGLTWAVTLY